MEATTGQGAGTGNGGHCPSSSLQLARCVRYCGADECQLSRELRKSLARARKVEDDPTETLVVKFAVTHNAVSAVVVFGLRVLLGEV
jgi:hypothetical protein